MDNTVDGDKSLVCADRIIVNVAERNSHDIVPLYYNMRKAGAEHIDNHSIYKGLKTAYTGGNIGVISNDITKIWNSGNVNLDVIKLLCMENNFTIDFAKTLYKPERPKDKKSMITDYTKLKVPHFFIYAKDKSKDKVEKINNSVVNKLDKIIPNPRISFKATNLGKFNYKMLMHNKKIELDQDVIRKYTELDLKKRFITIEPEHDDNSDNIYIYRDIKNKILEVNSNINYVVDVLVEYLYNHKKSNYKTTLWSSFGDIIVENLKHNLKDNSNDDMMLCEICGKRIEQTINNKKYCESCQRELQKKWQRESMKRLRENRKCEVANETCNP